MALAAGARLGRYEVLGLIGAGGMGEVYRARDTRLGRVVALKVLPPQVASDPVRRERFEREARAASALEHPHICVLHDVCVESGVEFLVLELIEGETLAERLRRGRVGREEALRIGVEVADALDAAHRKGVVHRDLKPGNVMLGGTGAKLLDFGLAHLREEPKGDEESTAWQLSGQGMVAGTVPYMSPEQLLGKRVDARSDIWALGVVLYEMLTGRRPFEGGSTASLAAAILEHEPEPLSSLDPQVAPALEHVVGRCLAKDPEARWQTARDVANELGWISGGRTTIPSKARAARAWRWWAVAAAVLVAAASMVAAWRWRGGEAEPAPDLDPNRVAVALFENRTGDKDLDSVALMATDAISRGLSRSGDLAVSLSPAVATGSGPPEVPPSGRGAAEAPLALAIQTQAGLVVTGAVYLEGDTLRFESRLVDPATGRLSAALEPVSGPRNGPSKAIDELGRRLITAVAGHVHRNLHPGVMHVPPYEAYQAWQRSVETWGSDFDATIRHLQRALVLDPSWLRLRLEMFMAYGAQYKFREAAKQLALVERDADMLAPYDRQGLRCARAFIEGKWSEAADARRQQDRLAPGVAWIRTDIGVFALYANQPRRAAETLTSLQTAFGVPSPANSWVTFLRCDALHMLEDYATELTVARQGRRDFPGMAGFCASEARAFVALGRLAEAVRAVDESSAMAWAPAVPVGGELSVFNQLDPGQVMCLVSMELGAHGHREAGLAVARRAAAWFEKQPAGEANTPGHRWLFALALFLSERWDEARAAYAPLADLSRPLVAPGWSEEGALVLAVRFRGRLGVIAARRGDRAEAERIAEELRRVNGPYLFGEDLYRRACIAAQLGQKAQAVGLLRETVAAGLAEWSGYAESFHRAPELEPLRGYAPFEELIRPQG
jgi:tetratricopeptide (TPR) repeat protein